MESAAPEPTPSGRAFQNVLYDGKPPEPVDLWCDGCGEYIGRGIPGNPTDSIGDLMKVHKTKRKDCRSWRFHGHRIIDAVHSVTMTFMLNHRRPRSKKDP